MDTFLQDVRYALRTLSRSRMFAVIAVACLALGIGVNTTIFSVVNAILLRPFDFREPERLVVLEELNTQNGGRAGVAWPNLVDWRAQSTAFSDMAAVEGRSLTLANVEEPERLEGSAITWNLFPMLGVSPAIGRLMRADEDRQGGDRVVLLSDGLWERRFGRDPAIAGKTLMLNELPHTIIGVMGPGFKFPEQSEIWIPLREADGTQRRDFKGLFVFARLAPGATIESARASLTQVATRLAAEYSANAGWSAHLTELRNVFIPDDVRLVVL